MKGSILLTQSVCYFCLTEHSVTAFGGRRPYDLSGVPTFFAARLGRATESGFPACASCAVLIRAKDPDALMARSVEVNGGSNDITVDQGSAQSSAEFWQSAFWAGLTKNAGSVINVTAQLKPAMRVFFELLNAGMPDLAYPRFLNGVTFYVRPVGVVLGIEHIQSARPGRGHARSVMRLAAAAADLHGAYISASLTERPGIDVDRALKALRSFGFAEPREHGPGIVLRPPDSAVDPLNAITRVQSARAALA